MEEDIGQEYIINDEEFDFNNKDKKYKCSSLNKKIFLSIIIIILILFSILLIVIISISNKSEGKKEEESPEKEILGEILCQYQINDITSEIQILNKDFKKISNFDIIINGIKLKDYTTKYKFSSNGKNEIKYVFYDNINIDNMFKDIGSIKTVEMISDKKLKIISMQSAFENCTNLESFKFRKF